MDANKDCIQEISSLSITLLMSFFLRFEEKIPIFLLKCMYTDVAYMIFVGICVMSATKNIVHVTS